MNKKTIVLDHPIVVVSSCLSPVHGSINQLLILQMDIEDVFEREIEQTYVNSVSD